MPGAVQKVKLTSHPQSDLRALAVGINALIDFAETHTHGGITAGGGNTSVSLGNPGTLGNFFRQLVDDMAQGASTAERFLGLAADRIAEVKTHPSSRGGVKHLGTWGVIPATNNVANSELEACLIALNSLYKHFYSHVHSGVVAGSGNFTTVASGVTGKVLHPTGQDPVFQPTPGPNLRAF